MKRGHNQFFKSCEGDSSREDCPRPPHTVLPVSSQVTRRLEQHGVDDIFREINSKLATLWDSWERSHGRRISLPRLSPHDVLYVSTMYENTGWRVQSSSSEILTHFTFSPKTE